MYELYKKLYITAVLTCMYAKTHIQTDVVNIQVNKN